MFFVNKYVKIKIGDTMKKKILIILPIVIFIVIIIGIIFNKNKLSTITIDINPSIKIKVRNNNIVSVEALNEDAKNIIEDLKGKSIDKGIELITTRIIDKVERVDNKYIILINTNGSISNKDIENKFNKYFKERNTEVEIISIDNITKEDEELAKEYNITPSKASYINSLKKENNNVEINEIVDKPVSELKETKESGYYCDDGLKLDGEYCLKEVSRVPSKEKYVCSPSYYEYNGKCYEETETIEVVSTKCEGDFKYKDGNCIRELSMSPKGNYKCNSGKLAKKDLYFRNASEDVYICIDTNKSEKPTLRCLTGPHKIINGECYVGPAPTIGGGCPSPDKLVGGGCYSKDPKDQYVCPDGAIYHVSQNSVPDYCPDTLKYTSATLISYSCENGYTLKNNKCINEEVREPLKTLSCPTGYTLTESNQCINLNKMVEKDKVVYCEDENSKFEADTCVIYEKIKAKK